MDWFMLHGPMWLALLALFCGFGLGWLTNYRHILKTENELKLSLAKCTQIEQRLLELHGERESSLQELKTLRAQGLDLNVRLKESQTHLKLQQQAWQEKWEQSRRSEEQVEEMFEQIARVVFDRNSVTLSEKNKINMELVLSPMREQLEQFRRQVQELHSQETKERLSLKHEIDSLNRLNQQMSAEAAALTRALKGDNKRQGNWGELILKRLLELSGLTEGREYQIQQAMKNEQGQRLQPDVIIRLPGNKQVIVDAKVSLTAFERYFNAEQEDEEQAALKMHLQSLRNHIRELGQKNYHQLSGIHSLQFVLMFVSLEPAFQLALAKDATLLQYAMERNVLLVSPSSLLVTLRSIDAVWSSERQTQNAKVIAEQAARMYDKLRLFSEEMLLLGGSLDRAQDSYQQAMNRLSQGRGNLIGQAEKLKQLGVEVNRSIPEVLIEERTTEDWKARSN